VAGIMTEDSASEPEPDDPAPLNLSNTQRLRTHLASGSLAAALLTAWEDGDPAQAQARMLAAANDFHAPKQAGGDQIPTRPN
jgi:hypothetical protein